MLGLMTPKTKLLVAINAAELAGFSNYAAALIALYRSLPDERAERDGQIPADQDKPELIVCPSCHGRGEWETECCNGSGGCDCRGQIVPLGCREVTKHIELWSCDAKWDASLWAGTDPTVSYRTRKPIGYFIPPMLKATLAKLPAKEELVHRLQTYGKRICWHSSITLDAKEQQALHALLTEAANTIKK